MGGAPVFLGLVTAICFFAAAAPAFAQGPVVRYEQDDTRISYVKPWTALVRPFHSGGSYAYVNRQGGKATVRFNGISVAYITNKDTLYGIAKVTLDGGTPAFVDLYNPIRNIAQSNVWSATGLVDGDHVLTIEWTGMKNPGVGWMLRGPRRGRRTGGPAVLVHVDHAGAGRSRLHHAGRRAVRRVW